ncbi:hypothetical protein [Flagellimonas meridianipacifica]|uniref:GLPGLI family protein n=1 Tax=Flagellimonas meridianipacifica TaxID=1080225 RepID=A0A2T0MAL4_9FLAO|nr:hypothetical protein [Allomuricauda pacifica]PRX54547.1 hypothetical protein CLV81_2949 [Allomuricauda pacifica]
MPQVSLRKSTIALLLSIFCGYTVALNGQNTPTDSLYLWFDEQIGLLNTGLYASQEYVEEYQVINDKHRFFESPNYLTGTLWQKSIPFHKVFLKYDLFEDQIIVYPKGISGASSVKLDLAKVDSFQIQNRKFVKKSIVDTKSNPVNGFFEVLLKGTDFTLLKKHRKTDVRKLNRNRVYYEFKEKNEYALAYKGVFYEIKNRRDVISVFPISKDIQKEFLAKKMAKELTDTGLRLLLQEIEAHLTKKSG